MKIDIKNLPKSKIQITVCVPFNELKKYINLAYENLSKNLKIAGFRQGKIPKEILEKNINQNDLYNEIMKIVIENTLPEIIQKNKIEIIDHPQIQITKMVPNQEIEYIAEATIMPKIENLNYKDIKIKKNKITVENKEVDDTILWLRKSRAKYFKVDRPARFNDLVSIDFETYVDGVCIENGAEKNHQFILGEGKFLPGFEKELEKMKSGEEKQFSLKVDKNYYHKAIAGKIVNFRVKMRDVQQIELPELTDDFAKSLGNFENIDSLKKSIFEGLFQEKELAEKNRIRMEIIDELIKKNNKLEIPEILINQEIEKIKSEITSNIAQYGIDFKTYLSNIEETEESFNQKILPQAEKRITAALILKAIADKENISVNQDEIEEEIIKIMRDPKISAKIIKNIDEENLRHYTENVIKNEKVLDFLEKEAIV